jgi:predicted DNA-binding ribbon-helix-helix protein
VATAQTSRQLWSIALPKDGIMKSLVVKRSIVVHGHKTSVSLEDAFWQGLKEIALSQRTTLSNMVADIDARRQHGNLSSVIRLYVLDRLRVPASNYSEQRENGFDLDKKLGRAPYA